MIPGATLHIVNGRQLSDKQYVAYLEAEAWRRGYKAASVNIKKAIAGLDTTCSCCGQPAAVEFKPAKWQGERDRVVIEHKKWQKG